MVSENSTKMQNLLFRRQFILGPRFVERFASWQTMRVGGRLFLHAHPDVELTQENSRGFEATLIGYIIDPNRPDAGNPEILKTLLTRINTARDIFTQTISLNGRYVLILDDGQTTILFCDALGLRQVYYTNPSWPDLWCASELANLAEEIEVQYDEEIVEEMLEIAKGMPNQEYWWPGDSSPYPQINRLLPNHYLDLRERVCKRYWPVAPITSLSFEEGVTKCADLLKKFVESAAARFPLALPITAGYDSRTILAATRNISPDVYYYTFLRDSLSRTDTDIVIPAKLLANLGIPHHILDYPSNSNDLFSYYFNKNVFSSHKSVENIAEILNSEFPPGRVMLSSHGSEIGRCLYHKFPLSHPVTSGFLAAKIGMHGKFVRDHLQTWLDDANGVAQEYGYNVLDLFYWEQRIGSWGGNGSVQLDIIHDRFDPFNCHEIASLMLAVNIRYRRPPYRFHTSIIKLLWPEALGEPINPAPLNEKIALYIKLFLVDANLYVTVRDLSSAIRKLFRST